MARLFFPTSADSVTCKRCGNDIPSDADTCPHCGADHGPGFGAAKTAALTTGLRLPFGPRREALNIPSPYPSVPEESELAGTGEQRWDMSKTITLGAVALALVAGGVIYSQHGSNSGDDTTRSELPAGHSAYGAIDMKTAHDAPARSAAPTPAVPPVLGIGPGTETRSPMAAVVLGGLTVSTLLSLIVVPAFYVVMARKTPPQPPAPERVRGNPQARQEWAVNQVLLAAKASRRARMARSMSPTARSLSMTRRASRSGALMCRNGRCKSCSAARMAGPCSSWRITRCMR